MTITKVPVKCERTEEREERAKIQPGLDTPGSLVWLKDNGYSTHLSVRAMPTKEDVHRHNKEFLQAVLKRDKVIRRLEEDAATHKLVLASVAPRRPAVAPSPRQRQDVVSRAVKQKVKIEASDELPARAEDGRSASDEEDSDSYYTASESHVNRAPLPQEKKKKKHQEIRANKVIRFEP